MPAARARVSIRRAKLIFVANLTSSGTPAAAHRSGSSVQDRGREHQLLPGAGDTHLARTPKDPAR